MKRKIALLLAVLLIVCHSFAAFAAEDGIGSKDGVDVQVKTNKDSYKGGEKVDLQVEVKNTNAYNIDNVTVQYSLPEELKQDSQTQKNRVDVGSIEAGQVYTTDMMSITLSGSAGLSSNIIIAIIVAVVVIAILAIVILILKKKKQKVSTTVSMLLVTFLVTGLLAPSVYATSENTPTDTSETTTVNNSDYKRISVHDPSIVKDPSTGTYYIFGSHLAFAKSTDLKAWSNFSCNVITDYNELFGPSWEYSKTTANPTLHTPGGGGNLWAPDVIYNDTMKKWCMYMSVNGNDWKSSIVLLTADNIEGPYAVAGTVVYSGITSANAAQTDIYKVLGDGADIARYAADPMQSTSKKMNAIDPNVQYDENGDLWMSYGSWSAGIYQLKLDTKTGLRDYSYDYEKNKIEGVDSDPYIGYKLAGGCYVSGEAPYILKTNDYYYLFVSLGGLTAEDGYQMRIFRSKNIQGPYVDQNNTSACYNSYVYNVTINTGYRLLASYSWTGTTGIQVAQGHNSAFVDDDGKMYVVYHTRFSTKGEGHEVRVHQLFETEDGWLVAAPYEYSNETIPETGYATEEVTGEYEVIEHSYRDFYHKSGQSVLGVEGATAEASSVLVKKKIKIDGKEVVIQAKVSFTQQPTDMITLNADGTVSGSKTGTWEVTEGTANVTLKLDDKEYKGVFIKQATENVTRDEVMTFTIIGNNMCIWGSQKANKE